MMVYTPTLYEIYVEVDEKNRIVKIFSDLFEQPTDKSIFIEAGQGDRFTHAHLYLEKPIYDTAYNYKYEDGEVVERTEEEKQEDITHVEPQPTELEIAQAKIAELEEELLSTNTYLTEVEIAGLNNEAKANALEEELKSTNQYLTELELLVFENII